MTDPYVAIFFITFIFCLVLFSLFVATALYELCFIIRRRIENGDNGNDISSDRN